MKFKREFHPKDGNCFVLMPHGIVDGFDWDNHYRDIADVITDVKMNPVRADDIYSTQQQLIERVWKGIQEAEIILADLTGRDPNVMYELGLAHVIWKPVILLATEDSIIPDHLTQYRPIRYTPEGRGLVQLIKDLKKALQAAHAEPKEEEAELRPLFGRGVERISAKILTVTKDCVIVQAIDGRKGILSAEDSNWIFPHPDLTRYKEGEEIHGAFVRDTKGESKYSLIAVQDNPWEKLEEKFPVDYEFTGIIVNKTKAGVFVKMDFGINGFIPANTIHEHLEHNDEIRAKTFKIDRQHRHVELRFIRKLLQSAAISPQHEEWNFSVGQQFNGTVASVNPSKGYALVQINEETKGLLHIRDMDETVKKKFDANELQVGDEIKVEVRQVNKADKKLNLKSNGM